MSTLSLLATDRSELLAKRFASIAADYLSNPSEPRTEAAQVPIENLFRLLQMFRHDAFADEPSSGVLEFRSLGDPGVSIAIEDEWHQHIASALEQARTKVFGTTPKDKMVDEVQSTLSWLATNQNAPEKVIRDRTKEFLDSLVSSLS